MWGPAFEAAEYVIADAERRLDERIGTPARKTIGRYSCAVILGIPTAYVAGDLHWNALTWSGFACGMALFAILDTLRAIVRERRASSRLASSQRASLHGGGAPPPDGGNATPL